MSELGETFKAFREESQLRRQANMDRALERLTSEGIAFKMLSPTHLSVGNFHYWPTTGLFMHKETKRRGRGVKNLIRELERTEKKV